MHGSGQPEAGVMKALERFKALDEVCLGEQVTYTPLKQAAQAVDDHL